MTLPTTFVAATDFSPDARRAARRAALLARECQVPLVLVHALDVGGLTTLTAWLKGKSDIQQSLADQARTLLEVAAQEVQQQVNVNAGIELRQGSPLAELASAGAQAGILILGARGAHAMREVTIGTTADRLLRKTHVPMLVVKAEPTQPYRNALALVDFSPASRAALAFALELAPGATFRLLHTFELPYEGQLFIAGVAQEEIDALREAERQRVQEQLRDLLQDLGPDQSRVTTRIEHGDVRFKAAEAVKEFTPDLIVVGKHGRSQVEDFFLGSVTRAMLSQVPCDLLITPGAQAA